MKAVLIANLGHSDLELKTDIPEWGFRRSHESPGTGVVYKPSQHLLQLSDRIWNTESRQIKAMGIPFQLPLIQGYLRVADIDQVEFTQLYLIGSRQPDREHSSGDSYRLAEALKKHQSLFRLPAVKPKELATNPSDWSSVVEEMERIIGEIAADLRKTSPGIRVYVGLSGGTPQMNAALLHISSELLRREFDVRTLYVPRGGPAQPVDAIDRFWRRQEAVALRTLYREYQYHTLAEVLGSASHGPSSAAAAISHLARYGCARLNSDWEAALRALHAAQPLARTNLPIPLRNRLDVWAREVNRLAHPSPHEFPWVQELLWHAAVTLKQGVWWAFLVRLATFREVALRILAARLGVPFDNPVKDRRLPSQYVTTELRQFAEARGVNLDVDLNHVVLDCVCEFIFHSGGGDPALLSCFKNLKALKPLVDLRNRVVHEGARVDAQVIVDALKPGVDTIQGFQPRATAATHDASEPADTVPVRANRKVDHRDNLNVDHPGVGFKGSSACGALLP